jgi:hypothetical protein
VKKEFSLLRDHVLLLFRSAPGRDLHSAERGVIVAV